MAFQNQPNPAITRLSRENYVSTIVSSVVDPPRRYAGVVTSPSVTSINLTLPGSLPLPDGGTSTIAGTLDLPGVAASMSPEEFRDAGIPVALAAHCFTCTRATPGIFRISRALARSGIACLRLDFPGLGDSGPDNGGVPFEDTTFSSNVDDLVGVADWLGTRLTAPSLLVGHSLGGAAVLRAAPRIPSVRAVATVAAPYLPGRAAANLLDGFADATSDDDLRTVHLAGRDIQFRRRFLTDLAERSAEPAVIDDIASLGRRGVPLLVLHSPTDLTVPVGDAEAIFAAASWPKSLMSLPDADHLLTRRGSAQRAGEMVSTWAEWAGIRVV